MPPNALSFQATIYRIWMLRHVDVPDGIVHELQKQMRSGSPSGKSGKQTTAKYIPVVAIVNSKLARATLVPAGGGRFRMQINTTLRKAAHADDGDLVGVELRLDRDSRTLPVPADLQAGLKQHPKAWKAFQSLAPGHRRHFIQWYDSAKSPEARDRRLNRAVDVLLERALLGQGRRQKQQRAKRD
jgi:Bacteriocin-protection, YdeI or OmpD-Associated/Domain of unknown function (DUF1905)